VQQGQQPEDDSFVECESVDSKLKKFEDVNSSEAVKSKKFHGGFQHRTKTYKMELQGIGVVLIWLSASEKQRLTRREFERQKQL
jgi:hypothetical protein